MRSIVTVVFNPRQSLELAVDTQPSPHAARAARDWFDTQWQQLGCEPLRASGKVLLLDKIVAVADALGYAQLLEDEGGFLEFAAQTAQALEKPRIVVDIPGLAVGF